MRGFREGIIEAPPAGGPVARRAGRRDRGVRRRRQRAEQRREWWEQRGVDDCSPRLLPQRHPRHGHRRCGKGIFEKNLGSNKLETSTFKAGTEASEALNADAIDATYIGSGPGHQRCTRSRTVRPSGSSPAPPPVERRSSSSPTITVAADLKGKTIVDPEAGQHPGRRVAGLAQGEGLRDRHRRWRRRQDRPAGEQPDAATFIAGDIDGAWVPEPWATRLVDEGGGKVLVDERDLWPDGEFVTTHLIVATKFLNDHPDVVKQLLAGPGGGQRVRQRQLRRGQDARQRRDQGKITGKPLKPEVIAARGRTSPSPTTRSPVALRRRPSDAEAVGLLDGRQPRGHLRPDHPQRGPQGRGEKETRRLTRPVDPH